MNELMKLKWMYDTMMRAGNWRSGAGGALYDRRGQLRACMGLSPARACGLRLQISSEARNGNTLDLQMYSASSCCLNVKFFHQQATLGRTYIHTYIHTY